LGAALAAAVPGIAVYAVDIEPAAVACARRNLEPVGGHVYQGDLFEPLPVRLAGHVDTLVANVPYVPTAEVDLMPREARLYEPLVALNGGPDGLDVLRRLATEGAAWLAPGGHLYVEVGAEQVPAAYEALDRAGLTVRVTHCADLDATVLVGRR
jgi:release factor glutamine methyltransferase